KLLGEGGHLFRRLALSAPGCEDCRPERNAEEREEQDDGDAEHEGVSLLDPVAAAADGGGVAGFLLGFLGSFGGRGTLAGGVGGGGEMVVDLGLNFSGDGVSRSRLPDGTLDAG